MQALYDFFPLIAFFTTYWFAGIYAATGVLMAVTVAVALGQWLKRRKVSPMLLASAGLALLFGGLTFYFHNPLFIMWKPTIVDLLFAGVLFASQLVGPEPLLKKLTGHVLRTDARTWRIGNASLALFFVLSGVVNIVVAYEFSVAAWVRFKFASIVVLFVFFGALMYWLAARAETVES